VPFADDAGEPLERAPIAIFVSRTEKTASAAARRMSQAVIRSIPPPMQ